MGVVLIYEGRLIPSLRPFVAKVDKRAIKIPGGFLHHNKNQIHEKKRRSPPLLRSKRFTLVKSHNSLVRLPLEVTPFLLMTDCLTIANILKLQVLKSHVFSTSFYFWLFLS